VCVLVCNLSGSGLSMSSVCLCVRHGGVVEGGGGLSEWPVSMQVGGCVCVCEAVWGCVCVCGSV